MKVKEHYDFPGLDGGYIERSAGVAYTVWWGGRRICSGLGMTKANALAYLFEYATGRANEELSKMLDALVVVRRTQRALEKADLLDQFKRAQSK